MLVVTAQALFEEVQADMHKLHLGKQNLHLTYPLA
jgi:hypothetical protein